MVASYNNMKHSIGKPQPQNHKKNHEKQRHIAVKIKIRDI